MKHQNYSPDSKPASARLAPKNDGTNEIEIAFAPCPDEVARKAYFTYVNAGCPQGCDVQHWLDAEAGLIKERERTRVHAFHRHT